MGGKISRQDIIQRLSSLQRTIFTDEVLNYLCNQTAKEASKIMWMIRLLDEEGLSLPDNYLHPPHSALEAPAFRPGEESAVDFSNKEC
ncbi:hypothetical protein SDD30_15080 [Moorella naiadis]|uniref:hypothetical protein n=1 Tax=Moorella naiadis (nom. illeg.) TaxID=3093670 RepID=UPI003D9CA209